ncbi:cold-shock protein [Methylobacter sp. YRD-M1]|jgi:cold shock CspA family protein|uniref:cold-shock protein n=1 Tax=Methylobacter sp. YRD-M1 TaxID=2911520 RepID=UPI002DD64269|nr:cold shock domain-containing protein [Methylobacter sp. YRD-M1]
MRGTVKWFSSEKGYGFITSESGEDHYFNVQGIEGISLPSNGDSVSFESKFGSKGLRAINVSITEKAITPASEDYRIYCDHCGRKIVPRIITYQGNPEKSVCPYCAWTVKDFRSKKSDLAIYVSYAFIAFVVYAVFTHK